MAMLRLAIVCDFLEEQWPSMDLVAEMLSTNLRTNHAQVVQATPIRPRWTPRFSRLPIPAGKQAAFSADRLVNRMWDYPRYLRRGLDRFDCFHICDHSYAHLVHVLPPERTGVYCHDLDCFRCLLDPKSEPRPRWFRALSRRILLGMQKAGVVFYSTAELGRRIREHGVVDPDRLVYAPYGVSAEFTPEPDALDSQIGLIPGGIEAPFLLHVGSCIPRKRIDVLLDVFASIRKRRPDLNLVQIGGQWTRAQQDKIDAHRLGSAVRQIREVDRFTVAALYRRAAVVLLPSEAEGFGLPVVEALACGAVPVVSDIPVLREVGGEAAVYCPVANGPRWLDAVNRLIVEPDAAPDRAVRIARARCFSWEKHAETILKAYQRLR
jgi:glycosyltransferase involved in cell wall biosynthesis